VLGRAEADCLSGQEHPSVATGRRGVKRDGQRKKVRDGMRLRQGDAPSALKAGAQRPDGAGGETGLGASSAHAVEASKLEFRYGNLPVVAELNLQIPAGEIYVILGPSGCGKSTVLNMIAGTIQPTSGDLTCFSDPIVGQNKRVSYMTQKDTLLPWRNALDNAALPLEIKHVPKKERHDAARNVLSRVGLEGFYDYRPHQLSGGMRSRLSLARALLSDADIFLMDEPFAAVDALSRLKLQQLVIDVWDETRKTMVYVTHDLYEAIALGHTVAVMTSRPARVRLEQPIPAPDSRDVADFKGSATAQQLYGVLWNALAGELGE
jgi:NitT/TauT family transport system ATP-binding protein